MLLVHGARAALYSANASEAQERVRGAQISLRNNRRLQTAMRSSQLRAINTLKQFDFAFQPSIQREQIESLHELGFVKRRENVIFLGPPGVGKMHLALSLRNSPPLSTSMSARRKGRLLRSPSIFINPGAGSFQSANVRMGTLLRSAVGVLHLRRWPATVRMSRNSRSIVDALMVINLERISPLRQRWPLRSSADTRIGNTVLSRFPHTRSDASQSTINA